MTDTIRGREPLFSLGCACSCGEARFARARIEGRKWEEVGKVGKVGKVGSGTEAAKKGPKRERIAGKRRKTADKWESGSSEAARERRDIGQECNNYTIV